MPARLLAAQPVQLLPVVSRLHLGRCRMTIDGPSFVLGALFMAAWLISTGRRFSK